MPVALTDQEELWLSGASGRAMQLAVEVIVATAIGSGATELVPVEFAHIGSSFWSGQISVDFAEFLLREGVQFAVPTATNAAVIDRGAVLRDSARFPDATAGSARLIEIYTELGAQPMWSCAPYHQDDGRPDFGQHVVGSESNAVSFFNSVLGARTNKYGDFLDVCGALVGRVPLTGLHTDQGRVGSHLFQLDVSDELRHDAALPHLVGIVLGANAGAAIPVIDGLGVATEDELKAIGAAGATSGAVEMFHVVGVTPEAATLDDALGGRAASATTVIDDALLNETRRLLSTNASEPVDTVCFGTPHFSVDEFGELHRLLDGRSIASGISCIVTTSRAVMHEVGLRGWAGPLEDAGVQIVLDTCSYYTPRMAGIGSHVMTNSAKWAYYAPGILGVDVTFAALDRCVETVAQGRS